MPNNYNTNLFRRAIELFNIKDGIFFRHELPYTLTPVVPITPVCNIAKWLNPVVSGTGTLYTTPSDKDFYICSAALAVIKDATCDVSIGSIAISITTGGLSQNILMIPVLTTTAQSGEINITFPFPIKCDRNSAVTLTGTYAAGLMSRSASIAGYVDNTLS